MIHYGLRRWGPDIRSTASIAGVKNSSPLIFLTEVALLEVLRQSACPC